MVVFNYHVLMKKTMVLICCVFALQTSWSQDDLVVSRDSLKSVLLELKAQSKTENIDSTLALIEFYNVHNPNLESPLHGELVIADAMKRIEKTRDKQKRREQFSNSESWTANPKQRTDADQSDVESVQETPFVEITDAVPSWQVKEVPLDQSQAENTGEVVNPGEVENSAWTARNENGLTERSDSEQLHAKLVEVKALLLDSRKNMLLSGASFAGGLIFLAIEGYAIAVISFVAIPVFALIGIVKRHSAIRALKSVQ